MMTPAESQNEDRLSDLNLPPALTAQQYVYYVYDDVNETVKIGLSANPARNLHTIQRGNPNELKLIGWHVGDYQTEAAIQKLFRGDKIRGEWFSATKQLVDFIESQVHIGELFVQSVCPKRLAELEGEGKTKNLREYL